MNTISEESIFGNDVLAAIMDKASPWTSYCMALTCKDMLKHYESGKCPHNPPRSFNSDKGDSISCIFDNNKHQDVANPTDEDPEPDDSSEVAESDTESCKLFFAQQEREGNEWLASRDNAGSSKPLGDFRLGAMTICGIRGLDFNFVCDNSDGAVSERRLLLIDDYWRLKKGDRYVSFVADHSGPLPIFPLTTFRACFPQTKQYQPCAPRRQGGRDDFSRFCKNKKQIAMSNRGLFDGENSEEVKMSDECHRGYECVGFDIQVLETPDVFRVKLELYDAEHYVS